MTSPLFRAKGVGKKNADGTWLFRNIDIQFHQGILTVTGPSGVGKSTLLKCINQTITMDEGQVWLEDRTPDQWGIPTWRSKVMYIPQRPPIMEGTPLDFVEEVRRFGTHKKNVKDGYFDDPVQIALDWGIRPDLWHSKWNTLSGGEMQRISLAIGCSFRPEILLLDEPTSALDEVSCEQVEKTLGQINCIWVTHNPQQAKRIKSAGELIMQGGDNSRPDSPSAVVVEEDGLHGNAGQNGRTHTKTTTNTYTSTSTTSSNSTAGVRTK
ncbi:hypothetical protein BGX28_001869 [Mortierella sp. GBA30]|nr:hypothetical protein BGX28_001869 [Mortierella sp. GBA30]